MNWRHVVNRTLARTAGVQVVRAGRPGGPGPVTPGSPRATPATGPKKVAGKKAAPTKTAGKKAKTLVIPFQTQAEVRLPAEPGDRLVPAPVFVLSSVRAGSTLLRLVLNAHSAVHAPHELHVRRLRVTPANSLSRQAMELLGHDEADLEHLLWDRVLHRELVRSGKQVIVDKTPSNSFAYERIRTCWPDARFIFLLRHPASIARSWTKASEGKRTPEEAVLDARRYMNALERARQHETGLTIRYEDLTSDPERVTREICEHLGLTWEAGMLDYGERGAPQEFVKGMGDWSDKVRSGSIQSGQALPADDEVPAPLLEISRTWGYLEGSTLAPTPCS